MNKKDDFELNLAKLLWALWKCLPIVLLISILTSGIAYYSFRTPVVKKYVSKVSFLVPKEYSISNRQVEYDTENDKNYTDEMIKETTLFSASINTYCSVAVAPTTCEIIASRAGLPYTGDELAKMVTATPEKSNTYTFVVSIKNTRMSNAQKIAAAFSEYLPVVFDEIAPHQQLRVLNPGSVKREFSGGADVKKTLTYTAFAAVLSCFVIVIVFIAKEYTGESKLLSSDVKRLYPEEKKLSVFSVKGKDEAIKRLRSNLLLTLPSGEGCRMIGLTAAHSDAAKDEIAIGLSRSLAEMGDRVLLVDADLRAHRLHDLMKLEPKSGLSDLIRQKDTADSAIELIKEDGISYSFLSAGDGAAAASELLDRRKLLPVLHNLQSGYDYIILNLEAIGSSIDAASVGKDLDGVLVAFRDEHCTRNQLTECMTQMEYASAKVLGFIELKKKAFKNNKQA